MHNAEKMVPKEQGKYIINTRRDKKGVNNTLPEFLTVAEYIQVTGFERNRVYGRTASRGLLCIRAGRSIRIPRTVVQEDKSLWNLLDDWPELLTIGQVQCLLRISKNTAYDWINGRTLSIQYYKKRKRIAKQTLIELCEHEDANRLPDFLAAGFVL